MLSRGSMTSSHGEGAGCAGLGSVAMVVSLPDFDWPRSAYSRALGSVGGQESAAGLVRTQLCRSECDLSQTSVANEVLRSTSTKTAASQATATQHVEL
jgi:hypothetical protein